jgi:hypothetical protein
LTILPLPNGVAPSGEYRKAEAELQEGTQIRHFDALGAPDEAQAALIVQALPHVAG